MATKDHIIDHLLNGFIIRPAAAGYSQTLNAAADAGQDEIDVGSSHTTGLSVGQVLFIGTGESLERVTVESIEEISSSPTGIVVVKENLVNAHVAGEAVIGCIAYDVGEPMSDGVSVTLGAQTTDVRVATRKTALITFADQPNSTAVFSLPYTMAEVFAWAFGMPTAAVSGAGTEASPKQFGSDLNNFGGAGDQCFVTSAVLKNGDIIRIELWAVDAKYSGFSWTAKRPTQNGIQISLQAKAGTKIASAAIDFNTVTTWRGTRNNAFNYLLEAGELTTKSSGGLSTTSTALEPVGEVVIALTAVTNIVKGSILRIVDPTGLTQHVMAQSVASLNVTLKTPLIRAVPSGSTVTMVEPTRYVAISEAGHTLAISGSDSELRADDHRFPVDTSVDDLTLTAGFPVLSAALPILMTSLGIDPASAVSGIIFVNSNIGTYILPGAYAKIQLANGDIGWFFYGNCQIPAENVQLVLNNANDGSPTLIQLTPTDELRFFVGPNL